MDLLLVVGFQPKVDALFAVGVGDGVGEGGFEAG